MYEGGSIDFYYNNGGTYDLFAAYVDSTIALTVNFGTNTTTAAFTIGTGVPVDDVVVPLTVTATNIFGAVLTTGVIPAQLATDPHIGLFARYTTTWDVAFDSGAATLVPEASSVLIIAACFMGCLASRQRRAAASASLVE